MIKICGAAKTPTERMHFPQIIRFRKVCFPRFYAICSQPQERASLENTFLEGLARKYIFFHSPGAIQRREQCSASKDVLWNKCYGDRLHHLWTAKTCTTGAIGRYVTLVNDRATRRENMLLSRRRKTKGSRRHQWANNDARGAEGEASKKTGGEASIRATLKRVRYGVRRDNLQQRRP